MEGLSKIFSQGETIDPAVDVTVDAAVLKDDAYNMDMIGSIDQGTSSTRFVVFTHKGRIAASAQMEHAQIFPSGKDKVGWHEHDPIEIWTNTIKCMKAVTQVLKTKKIDFTKRPLKAIGITNQRETTVAWNSETGVPYYNAIVWDDLRTASIASHIAKHNGNGSIDCLREETGLPLATYFAGTKVRWLLDNVPELAKDLQDEKKRSTVRFGTIDTWVLYQLTGQPSSFKGAANVGGIFGTDVTNASRWLFLNIHTMKWDKHLIDTICGPDHDLPLETALPKISSSSQIYGLCQTSCGCGPSMSGVPIASILGDQQAALFGQTAFTAGEAKCTYGTGLFLMMNTEEKIVKSTHGLLTTVGYQLGEGGPVHYALEGSVSHSGSVIQWLRDQLQILSKASESETLANTTETNDGLYFVPAFAGLFAPYWRSDARGCIVGMTATHTKGHVARAALEATAYQAHDVFDAIFKDSKVALKALKVDGGGTANNLLMQFQADMIRVPVVKPVVMETTSLGAALAAGLAVGVWKDVDEIKSLWAVAETFEPTMEVLERDQYLRGWKKAITKSLGWVDDEEEEEKEDEDISSVDGEDIEDAGDGYETAKEDSGEIIMEDDEEDQPIVEMAKGGSTPPTDGGYGTLTLLITGSCAALAGYLVGRNR